MSPHTHAVARAVVVATAPLLPWRSMTGVVHAPPHPLPGVGHGQGRRADVFPGGGVYRPALATIVRWSRAASTAGGACPHPSRGGRASSSCCSRTHLLHERKRGGVERVAVLQRVQLALERRHPRVLHRRRGAEARPHGNGCHHISCCSRATALCPPSATNRLTDARTLARSCVRCADSLRWPARRTRELLKPERLPAHAQVVRRCGEGGTQRCPTHVVRTRRMCCWHRACELPRWRLGRRGGGAPPRAPRHAGSQGVAGWRCPHGT